MIRLKRHGKGAAQGFGLGILIGALAGVTVGYSYGTDGSLFNDDPDDDWFATMADQKAAIGGIVGGLVGGIWGAIIGASAGSRESYILAKK